MNRLRRKFIIFNMIVCGAVAAFSAVIIYSKAPSEMTVLRIIGTIVVMLALVFIGSVLSSKFAMKPIQSSWQRQLDFASDASHELRTPLAVMQTNLELVMDNQDETVGSQLKWLNNIHIETVRMAKLVDDLLTLSRGDADAKTLECSLFSLNELAAETALLFETAAKQREIDIQVLADGEVQLWADAARIKQLLDILVDNAIKYMGGSGHIQIAVSKEDTTVQLIVSDTGKGIAPEHQAKIFYRFYRAESQASEGFGLGLSIAQWIVEEHGARIRVESVVGEGTRFIACFPEETSARSLKCRKPMRVVVHEDSDQSRPLLAEKRHP